jgi:hypothetical protein
MNTMSLPYAESPSKTRPKRSREAAKRLRELWRDIGVGLAVALLGLVLTGFAIKAGGGWPAADVANPAFHGSGVAPAMFQSGSVPVP